MATYHIRVSGKVQGVFYRATAKKAALGAGLRGWVRNTKEGDVEIMVTGEQSKLNDFAAWCRIGPAQASVTKVDVVEVPETSFNDFTIER